MPHEAGHVATASEMFEQDPFPEEGSDTAATGQTITFPNGGIAQVVRRQFGEFSVKFYEPPEGDVGPVTVASEPITLDGGWTLIPLTGGARPLLIPPQVNQTVRFIEIPEDPTKVLAVSSTGSITVIERAQAPVAAVEVGSQIQSDGTRRIFFADNTFRDVPPVTQFELGQIEERGGFQFVETSPGNFSRLPKDLPEGQVVTLDGRQFVRQPDGSIQPLAPETSLTLDQQIARALASGDAEAALALADFRDRPTSLEAFNAAMQFAQSPGDVFSISNIARGQTTIQAPESGLTQRIAQPPAFLQDALTRVMNLFRGGTGTPNDFVSIISSLAQSEDEQRKSRIQTEEELVAADNAREQAETDALHEKLQAERDKEKSELAAFKAKLQAEADAAAAPELTPEGLAATGSQDISNITQEQADLINEFFFQQTSGTETQGSTTAIDQTGATVEPAPEPTSLFPSQEQIVEPVTTGSSFISGFSTEEEDDFFAEGGVFDDQTAIVGEGGPELLIANPGARVIPLKGDDLAKLRKKFNIKSLAHGGTLEQLLPFGVHQALAGAIIEPTRRRLSTAAGLPVLSAQARQNLLPEELDVLDRLRAEAGIPLGAFQQEQASALPGVLRRRPSRFAARVSR